MALPDLVDGVAAATAARYALSPAAAITRINESENTTYRVDDPDSGRRFAMRVGKAGYQSVAAIESELSWIDALLDVGAVEAARPVVARDGSRVVTVGAEGLGEPRSVVVFEWLDGTPPDPENLASFRQLGEVCSRLHAQSRSWRRPAGFVRPAWNCEQFLGPQGRAGSWKDGVGVGREELAVLSRLEATIRRRLAAYGQGADRFGVAHNDLRPANLLVDRGQTRVIDFDDCGDAWYMADWATAVSLIEHYPQVPAMQDAWVEGYSSIAPLSREDEAELPTFVMQSRLYFVAWVGTVTHLAMQAETPLAVDRHVADAVASGAGYTAGTCELAEQYLSTMS